MNCNATNNTSVHGFGALPDRCNNRWTDDGPRPDRRSIISPGKIRFGDPSATGIRFTCPNAPENRRFEWAGRFNPAGDHLTADETDLDPTMASPPWYRLHPRSRLFYEIAWSKRILPMMYRLHNIRFCNWNSSWSAPKLWTKLLMFSLRWSEVPKSMPPTCLEVENPSPGHL